MNDTTRCIYPGQIYKHFKGKLYQIIAIATHSETNEKMVVYQQLYGKFMVYVRPYDMFISEVDHNKYLNVNQRFRFEQVKDEEVEDYSIDTDDGQKNITKDSLICESNEQMELSEPKTSEIEEFQGADKRLIEFLDAETFEEKRRVLISIKDNITDRLIDDMAASIDVTVDDGNIDDRFLSLLTCVNTRAKYEVNRLR